MIFTRPIHYKTLPQRPPQFQRQRRLRKNNDKGYMPVRADIKIDGEDTQLFDLSAEKKAPEKGANFSFLMLYRLKQASALY